MKTFSLLNYKEFWNLHLTVSPEHLLASLLNFFSPNEMNLFSLIASTFAFCPHSLLNTCMHVLENAEKCYVKKLRGSKWISDPM